MPLPIVLDLVDQHDNVTKTLTPSCVSEIKAEAEGLDKAALVFTFQVKTHILEISLNNAIAL